LHQAKKPTSFALLRWLVAREEWNFSGLSPVAKIPGQRLDLLLELEPGRSLATARSNERQLHTAVSTTGGSTRSWATTRWA